MWSSRIEGPGLDMWRLWKTRKTREKEKVFLDIYGSFLVIAVYSEKNFITGFSPHLEIESLVSVGRFGLWCTYKGTIILNSSSCVLMC